MPDPNFASPVARNGRSNGFRWKADPTFYPTARLAMQAPPERYAYVAGLASDQTAGPDALYVVDVNPDSPGYSQVVGRVDMPNNGDELHHFGWNACSTALCPYAPHPHQERRYLVVPGLRSSRIHIIDTKPDPTRLELVKVIEPEEVLRTGYSRPHTVHCGPEGLYVSALGAEDGGGPGGIFLLDHDTFNVLGRWEVDRGPQELAYDFWWHLGHDAMLTSEWGTPDKIESGLNAEHLLASGYGHALHVWDLRRRKHQQRLDLGKEYQMVLELRPSHDPTRTFGFVGVVVSLKDLSASVWLWHRDGGAWAVKKVIEIPAEPADPDLLPPLLKGFKAVPPLVTDINLSLDDRWLYVSCWGTGELRRYDVSNPDSPRLTGVLQIGGVARQAAHPRDPGQALNGGPQMVEVSLDGRRVYFTNSLYKAWDEQFFPDGIRPWMVKAEAPDDGSLRLDPNFWVSTADHRLHQVRLDGGDSSSDSYCYPP
ncbi:MAG TPA: selenium-binding protein SBP56-related protein [Chthoniobacterales bacterium]